MIVPAMNTQQLQQEYIKGYINLNRKVSSFINKIRRQVKGNTQKFVFYTYKDPQKNNWGSHIIVGKKQYVLNAFLLFNDPVKGKCAMNMNLKTGAINTFTGHFFKRYNERLQLGYKETIDSMQHFFLNMVEFSTEKTQDNRFHAELPNGVGFGYFYSEDWMEFKTFLTNDMLKGNQQKLSAALQEEMNIGKFCIEACQPDFRLAS